MRNSIKQKNVSLIVAGAGITAAANYVLAWVDIKNADYHYARY